MKRALIFVLVLLAASTATARQAKLKVIDVRRPTIVAFFPPISDAELLRDPDTNEALSDFQFYSQRVQKPLRDKGVEFHEVYAHEFALQSGKSVRVFKPGKVKVGYYFAAPGKKPRVEYGVTTDTDLLQTADEYLRTPSR